MHFASRAAVASLALALLGLMSSTVSVVAAAAVNAGVPPAVPNATANGSAADAKPVLDLTLETRKTVCGPNLAPCLACTNLVEAAASTKAPGASQDILAWNKEVIAAYRVGFNCWVANACPIRIRWVCNGGVELRVSPTLLEEYKPQLVVLP